MLTKDIPRNAYQPWQPMTNPRDLKTLGKLLEELGECSAAASRCLIQGIDEAEPKTGYLNRYWLQDELADVLANIELVVKQFNLDWRGIADRADLKVPLLLAWHNGIEGDKS